MKNDIQKVSKKTQNDVSVFSKSIPSDHEMMVYTTMAKQAVSSKMYRGIGDESGVMMIMLSARELGIPPMQALNGGINIINGKVEISARMISALIRKAGHKISVKNSTNDVCVIVGERCDNGESITSSFSVEDAKRAGIFRSGGGWTKFPKDLCFARALSRLSRQLFSDVIGIGYAEGEIRSSVQSSKNTEIEILQEDYQKSSEENEELEKKVLEKFNESDRDLAKEYIDVIMKHFEWSKNECLTKILNEDKVKEKFEMWKSKKYKSKEVD